MDAKTAAYRLDSGLCRVLILDFRDIKFGNQNTCLVKEVVFVELLRSLNLTPYKRQKRTIYAIDQVRLAKTQGLYFQKAGLLKSLLIGHT